MFAAVGDAPEPPLAEEPDASHKKGGDEAPASGDKSGMPVYQFDKEAAGAPEDGA
jgi:hypothetical protein